MLIDYVYIYTQIYEYTGDPEEDDLFVEAQGMYLCAMATRIIINPGKS